MKIIDLAEAVAPGAVVHEVGMRPGEKLHEEMISADDSRRTVNLGGRFVVTPVVAEWGYTQPNGIAMQEGVAYRSDTNDSWISQDDIRNFISRTL
jgi:UDP-N-acetylglucosamine 4,6-dehydratase